MSTSGKICQDGASKSEDDDVCEVKDMLQNMSVDENNVSVCSNCDKEGSNLKLCTACKLVKYCNRECQIAHRPQHKMECKRRVAELAAELHDKELFKQPPPAEDCPICFQRMPSLNSGRRYQTCCGKNICSGCINAPVYDNQGNICDIDKQNECPFCRAMAPETEEETLNRVLKRVEADDPIAILDIGRNYLDGTEGYSKDYAKAFELFHRAGELGYVDSYCEIGNAYHHGRGVGKDEKKAKHYFELGAIAGDETARHNLGQVEWRADNMDRALKHYMIAVRGGHANSLNRFQLFYTKGLATKEDYSKALHAYQSYLGEIKSDQRDKAAAEYDNCEYY